jgi:hypothetical protein
MRLCLFYVGTRSNNQSTPKKIDAVIESAYRAETLTSLQWRADFGAVRRHFEPRQNQLHQPTSKRKKRNTPGVLLLARQQSEFRSLLYAASARAHVMRMM